MTEQQIFLHLVSRLFFDLFEDIFPVIFLFFRKVVSIPSNIAEGYGRKTTMDYIRMLYISYGSVCELETQILLAGDLDLIEKGELGTAKKDIAEIERMLKALIKSLENKPLKP